MGVQAISKKVWTVDSTKSTQEKGLRRGLFVMRRGLGIITPEIS
jgi:hypothetical protein